MANAPTRPPNRHSDGRRPPRGPRRVPKRRDLDEARALVSEAVEILRKNKRHEKHADAVAYTLTPEYMHSVRYAEYDSKSSAAKNLPIRSTGPIRDHFQKASAAAGRDLTKDADNGLRKFVAGKFTPTEPTRAKYGTAENIKMINVRPNPDLRAQAEARCEELKVELGWKPGITTVLKQYFESLYGLPESDAGE